jgi:hypothetical protein
MSTTAAFLLLFEDRRHFISWTVIPLLSAVEEIVKTAIHALKTAIQIKTFADSLKFRSYRVNRRDRC